MKKPKLQWGIDPQYRPSSYFWARERGITLVSDIKGAARRKMYEMALQNGEADLFTPALTQHSLSSEDRRVQSRVHPALMGGEYLPDRRDHEVEIARIAIASTLHDVTCVYARPVGNRIHYRVMDEYGGDTLQGRASRTSLRPLSLSALTHFFFQGWDLYLCLEANFAHHGYPRDEVHGFIADASSSFYADFDDWVHALIDDWLDRGAPASAPEVEKD